MGGDGGSIPKRADVVRTSGYRFKRNLGGLGYLPNTQVRAVSERYNASEDRLIRLTHCSLTNQPLSPPLVACRLGLLYNKESFLERFLYRKTTPFPESLNHIKTRKDVKDLQVEFDSKTTRLICPITKVEFDRGVKGIFFWTCGCVLSSKAFNQLTKVNKDTFTNSENKSLFRLSSELSVQRLCPICSHPFTDSDIIPLVPDTAALSSLKRNLVSSQDNVKVKCRRQASDAPQRSASCTTEEDRKHVLDVPVV